MTAKIRKVAYHEKTIFSKPIWVAYYLDRDDNQMGKCVYGNTKKEALAELV
jgi:hypothetical protein